ncbi:hypothetical protein [Stenotrophomonas pavanii]|uniref:hypothetical protein n=1 Tax=Stenotrophomonas pavanii TaxID=487698 RepID=UPI002E75AB86|nr:hypothetical protein [Stenotrophomonas pavanii]
MAKTKSGPSVYYVTDKNIFDALNEHKVTAEILSDLLAYRNTISSPKEPRISLAKYFSRLTHDYFDNQKIASVLGVVPRRERMTSLFVAGEVSLESIRVALNKVAESYREIGDIFNVSSVENGYRALLQYSRVDYRRSEFNQVQVRDAEIEVVLANGGVEIRSNQSDYVDRARDACVEELSKANSGLERRDVSLIAFTDPGVRSKFFHDIFSGLPDFSFREVTDIYVYKPRSLEQGEAEDDPVVERIGLRGSAVSGSKWYADLSKDGYYVARVVWTAKEIMNEGNLFVIEALFADPKTSSDFSFLLQGVHDRLESSHQPRRRVPTKFEVVRVTRAIEQRSRFLMEQLRASISPESGGASNEEGNS